MLVSLLSFVEHGEFLLAYEHIVNITNKSETEGLSTITSSDQNSFSSDKACRKVTIRLKNASKINDISIFFSISIDAYKM